MCAIIDHSVSCLILWEIKKFPDSKIVFLCIFFYCLFNPLVGLIRNSLKMKISADSTNKAKNVLFFVHRIRMGVRKKAA